MCTKTVQRPVGSRSGAMQVARQRSYVTQCRIETTRKSAELGQFLMRNSKNGCNLNVSGCFLSFVLKLKTCCHTFLRRLQQSVEGKGLTRLCPQLPLDAYVIPALPTSVIAGGVGFSARIAVSFLATFVCAADTSLLMCVIKCVQMYMKIQEPSVPPRLGGRTVR